MTDNLKPVISPLSGVVYRKTAPDQEPFVEVGTEVKKGQTVCLVETMKVFTKIKAPLDGVVAEILVDNEEVVKKSQVLMNLQIKG